MCRSMQRTSSSFPPFKYTFPKGGEPLHIYKEKVSQGGQWQRFHAVKIKLRAAWDSERVSDNCFGKLISHISLFLTQCSGWNGK